MGGVMQRIIGEDGAGGDALVAFRRLRRESESVAAALDDYRWLVSDAAVPWLVIADEEFSIGGVSSGLLSQLRKDLSAERAHLVVEQVELRHRAREKFCEPSGCSSRGKGSSKRRMSNSRLTKPLDFAVGDLVADLCCGIGGDLVALARRGRRVESTAIR